MIAVRHVGIGIRVNEEVACCPGNSGFKKLPVAFGHVDQSSAVAEGRVRSQCFFSSDAQPIIRFFAVACVQHLSESHGHVIVQQTELPPILADVHDVVERVDVAEHQRIADKVLGKHIPH